MPKTLLKLTLQGKQWNLKKIPSSSFEPQQDKLTIQVDQPKEKE
jgi:hypothetical protein